MASLVLAAASFAVAACGGGASARSDAAPDAPALTATQACADLAHAACTSRDTCSTGFANAHTFGSEAVCETRTSANCVTELGSPHTAATPATREECAGAYTSDAETCIDVEENNPVTACTPPAGSGATSSACAVDAQCASAYCAVGSDAICGTCQPLPAVGATCAVTADCGRDLECAVPTGAATGTCAAYVAVNGACLTGVHPCAPGLGCVGDDPTTSTNGTCQVNGTTINAACDGTRATAATCAAEDGLTCVPTAAGSPIGTCQPIMLVGAGATCGSLGAAPITGFADCDAGGLCVKATATDKTGTCMAAAADGAACDTAAGPPCLSPAKCVPSSAATTAGTCMLPAPTTCT